MNELWELVNERGEKLGIIHQRGVRLPEGLCHLGVEVWCRVGDKILTTKRHPDKWQGGHWEATGGSVVLGEEVCEGAVRELAEETGITVHVDKLIHLGERLFGNFYAHSYLVTLDELPEVTLQEGETVDFKWVTREEFEALSLTYGTRDRYILYGDKIFADR